jgi:hypothetical protein
MLTCMRIHIGTRRYDFSIYVQIIDTISQSQFRTAQFDSTFSSQTALRQHETAITMKLHETQR